MSDFYPEQPEPPPPLPVDRVIRVRRWVGGWDVRLDCTITGAKIGEYTDRDGFRPSPTEPRLVTVAPPLGLAMPEERWLAVRRGIAAQIENRDSRKRVDAVVGKGEGSPLTRLRGLP